MMIKGLIFEQNREFNLSSDHSKFLKILKAFFKKIYINIFHFKRFKPETANSLLILRLNTFIHSMRSILN